MLQSLLQILLQMTVGSPVRIARQKYSYENTESLRFAFPFTLSNKPPRYWRTANLLMIRPVHHRLVIDTDSTNKEKGVPNLFSVRNKNKSDAKGKRRVN